MDIASDTLKEYELSFIISSEDGLKAVEEIISLNEGSVVRRESPRKIFLAYPIKKHNEAYFGYFIISLNPEKITSLNHSLNLSDSVIRFLIVSPVASPAPAPAPAPAGSSSAAPAPSTPLRRREPVLPTPPSSETLTNEALEKKLEEILQ